MCETGARVVEWATGIRSSAVVHLCKDPCAHPLVSHPSSRQHFLSSREGAAALEGGRRFMLCKNPEALQPHPRGGSSLHTTSGRRHNTVLYGPVQESIICRVQSVEPRVPRDNQMLRLRDSTAKHRWTRPPVQPWAHQRQELEQPTGLYCTVLYTQKQSPK